MTAADEQLQLNTVGRVRGEPAHALALDGQLAYVAAESRMVVVDISDPALARERCEWEWPAEVASESGPLRDLWVESGIAYLLARDRLLVFDVSEPCAARLQGTLAVSGAKKLAVERLATGTGPSVHVYVLGPQSLVRVDASRPSRPVEMAAFVSHGLGTFEDIRLSGGFAYLANGRKGVCEVPIGGEAHVLAGECEAEGANGKTYLSVSDPSYNWAADLAFGFVFTADGVGKETGGQVRKVHFRDGVHGREALAEGRPFQFPRSDLLSAAGIVVSRDHRTAFVHDGAAADIRLLEIPSLGRRPNHIVAARGRVPVRDMVVAGGHLYVLTGSVGNPPESTPAPSAAVLSVHAISNPDAPRTVRRLRRPSNAGRLVVAHDIAFIADGEGGVAVVHVDETGTPRAMASLQVGTDASAAVDVALYGDQAYVAATGDRTVSVFRTAEPFDARNIPGLTKGRVIGVDAAAGLLCAATGTDGLEVYDLSGQAFGRWVPPETWVALDNRSGASIQDCTIVPLGEQRPSQDHIPYTLAYLYTVAAEGDARQVKVYRLHRASIAGGRAEWRLSDSVGPPIAGVQRAAAIRYFGGHAYIAAGGAGLHVIDAREPGTPRLMGEARSDTGGRAVDVNVHDTRAYVVNDDGSVAVFDVSEPRQPRRVALTPANGTGRGIAVDDRFVYVAAGAEGLKVLVGHGDLPAVTATTPTVTAATPPSPWASPTVATPATADATAETPVTVTATPRTTTPTASSTPTPTRTATRAPGPGKVHLPALQRWRRLPTATVTPSPTPSCVGQPDALEDESRPNDSMTDARALPPLCEWGMLRGRLWPQDDDVDYYRVKLAGGLEARLSVPPGKTYNLQLFDHRGQSVDFTFDEEAEKGLRLENLAPGEYFLSVFGDDRSEEYYRLVWSWLVP